MPGNWFWNDVGCWFMGTGAPRGETICMFCIGGFWPGEKIALPLGGLTGVYDERGLLRLLLLLHRGLHDGLAEGGG